jgi:hypothetical protein
MPKSFATVTEVSRRVGEPIEAPEDIALAEALLEIVSEEIRAYGLAWPEPLLAPALCRTIAIGAAARGYNNPALYETERGDMLTLYRGSDAANGEALTKSEKTAIARVAGNGGVISVPVDRPVFPVWTTE